MKTKICVHTCVFELSRRGWENLNLAIQYNKSQLKISKNHMSEDKLQNNIA